MKYRDDMTKEELELFMAYLDRLEQYGKGEISFKQWEEGSLEYFNRYIAGDRK